jgi:hypothetical protein
LFALFVPVQSIPILKSFLGEDILMGSCKTPSDNSTSTQKVKAFLVRAWCVAASAAAAALLVEKLDLASLARIGEPKKGEFQGTASEQLSEDMWGALVAECRKYCAYLLGPGKERPWIPVHKGNASLSQGHAQRLEELNRILYGPRAVSLDSCDFDILGVNERNFLAVVQFSGTRNDIHDGKIIQLRVAFEGSFSVWAGGFPGSEPSATGAPRAYPSWKPSDEFDFGVISKRGFRNVLYNLHKPSGDFLRGRRLRKRPIVPRMPPIRRINPRK